MNDNIEYGINGDNFEYCQGLSRHSEEYYGRDIGHRTSRVYRQDVVDWDEINSEEYHLYEDL